MPARKNTPTLNEHWREKIAAGILADRLMKHARGELELTSTQIRAADILLKKVVPDLARTEHTGRDGGAIETKNVTKSDAEILSQYLQKVSR